MAKNLCLLIYSIFFINILYCGLHLNLLRLSKLNHVIWIENAAEEVEKVEAISCSGHGRAFLDGFVIDGDNDDGGKPVCECYACYTGRDCSIFSPPCIADADSGNPMFLEPFWMNQKETSSMIVPGWHRMGYTYPNESTMSLELEKYVRKLHEMVGNAITNGKYIVFGTGTTQLFNAAIHALSTSSTYNHGIVVASIPFYLLYQEQTDFFQSRLYKFRGDASLWKNKTEDANATFIEFVTSPNNPDGELKEAILKGNFVKTIYDRVYYWPHFTPIIAPANEDLMLFSISKFTGHAGSRFGWALVKDRVIHQNMVEYVTYNTLGVSQDTQLRMLKILKAIVHGRGREIFEVGHNVMKKRWERLKVAMSASSRFSLQYVPPGFCTFTQQIKEASPAYAWLKCERQEDMDCYEVLKAANIIGRKGQSYGAENRYVRLSMIKSQYDFELLLHNIELLVSIDKNVTIELLKSKISYNNFVGLYYCAYWIWM